MGDLVDGEFDIIRTPREDEGLEARCALVILIDCSLSMDGEPLAQVNAGLKTLFGELQQDPLAARRCEAAVLSFGQTVETELDFTVVSKLPQAPQLSARGNTPMGEAILSAIDMVQTKKQVYKAEGRSYYRPWIFMLTDGMPTDEHNVPQATRMVHEGERDRKFMFFAVGCMEADMDRLKDIASPSRPPLYLQGSRFAEMFEWLSRSMVTVSSSNPGDQKQLPPVGWGTVSA